MKSHFPWLFSFALFVGFPSHSKCLDGLQLHPDMGYQPQLKCSSQQIHQCFSEPPLLLVLSVPAADLSSVSSELQTQDQLHRYLVSIVPSTVSTKKYWKYTCKAKSVFPGNLYDCSVLSASNSTISNVSIYDSGLSFPSAVEGLTYSEYRKETLPSYYAEYTCHPANNDLIQLRQYHVGSSVREYYLNDQHMYNNPTGSYTILLKVSTFAKDAFVASSRKKRKLGFDMDPGAVAPIIRKIVPESLR